MQKHKWNKKKYKYWNTSTIKIGKINSRGGNSDHDVENNGERGNDARKRSTSRINGERKNGIERATDGKIRSSGVSNIENGNESTSYDYGIKWR